MKEREGNNKRTREKRRGKEMGNKRCGGMVASKGIL